MYQLKLNQLKLNYKYKLYYHLLKQFHFLLYKYFSHIFRLSGTSVLLSDYSPNASAGSICGSRIMSSRCHCTVSIQHFRQRLYSMESRSYGLLMGVSTLLETWQSSMARRKMGLAHSVKVIAIVFSYLIAKERIIFRFCQ